MVMPKVVIDLDDYLMPHTFSGVIPVSIPIPIPKDLSKLTLKPETEQR